MALIGNTVRLKVEFKTFDGVLVNPENVKLRIYSGSNKKNGLLEEINVEPIEEGKYQYDYTIPEGLGFLYFEFSGILEGKPILGRMKLERKWI